jgi:hypothetical protein
MAASPSPSGKRAPGVEAFCETFYRAEKGKGFHIPGRISQSKDENASQLGAGSIVGKSNSHSAIPRRETWRITWRPVVRCPRKRDPPF